MTSKDVPDSNRNDLFWQSAKLFKIIGMWEDSTKLNTVQRNIKGPIIILLGPLVVNIGAFTGYFDMKATGNVTESHVMLIISFGVFMSTFKMYSMWSRVSEIKQCIRWLQDFTRKFENQQFINRAKHIYRLMFNIGLFFLNVTLFFFALVPMARSTRRLPVNTKNPTSVIDILQSPTYEILFVYQTLVMISYGNIMVGCDTMFCGIMAIISAILESITDVFVQFFVLKTKGDLDEEKKKEVMRNIMEDFSEACRVVDFVKNLFVLITIAHFLYNIGIMAMALYVVSMLNLTDVFALSMLSNIILQVFQLGIYCYFGEEIADQTRKFRKRIYECDWFNQSENFKLMVLLTLQRTEKEPLIAAGKVVPLSYATFGEVLKKACAFFAFVYNFKSA